jgi:hypothetical protein
MNLPAKAGMAREIKTRTMEARIVVYDFQVLDRKVADTKVTPWTRGC